MSILEYFTSILQLLESVEEKTWSNVFKYFIATRELLKETDFCRKIFGIYVGAGSFNDLVLYKNGELCYDENEELDLLRNKLFNELVKCLYN